MNKLKLKECTSEHVIYYYQPEGKGDCGEIIYIFTAIAIEPNILSPAENDEFGTYGHKACDKVKELVDSRYLPFEVTQLK